MRGSSICWLRRPLACLLAGDAEGAALEMEKHLRDLHFMSRLVCQGAGSR
jgi:hypothetical protein